MALMDCYGSVSKKKFGFGIGGGYGGDCDSKCGTGYCTYAEPSLLDYPRKPDDWEGPWNCSSSLAPGVSSAYHALSPLLRQQ